MTQTYLSAELSLVSLLYTVFMMRLMGNPEDPPLFNVPTSQSSCRNTVSMHTKL